MLFCAKTGITKSNCGYGFFLNHLFISNPMEPFASSSSSSLIQTRLTQNPSSTASVWDLSYLMDFTLDDDDHVSIPFDHNSSSQPPITDNVRKRDPRLTCSNYLAGRVPCACPEEDEEAFPGKKKRVRTVGAAGGVARCQVEGCEADIGGLKGYHRRHRVCLRCANATTVMLHGEPKRYCQQCGKFHVSSDFDEGKRSCRRKLERHNNRRRRKPAESRPAAADHDLQPVMQTEDFSYDGEVGKDCTDLSSDINEKRASMDHEDGQFNTFCSTPYIQNINNNSALSFVASGETRVYGGKDVSNSPSYCDKNAYSSMCQTGRVSFKLYDWNPAEFPRRLRHQIFQWLASMPLELEGYIRPGCTILTIFISMPKFSWANLHEYPMHYVRDLLAPGKTLSGKGKILIHLNDMVFRIMEDGFSVMKVEVNVQAPRLHYVHPTCFEAGKPMEFVVCGSNLLQPKFRLLVSFSGKYLKYEHCLASTHIWTEDSTSCALDNQLYKILVPHTEPNLFGPAFIEVENESGLSNFIPVLIGDKEICSEMKILQQKLDMPLLSKQFQSASAASVCNSCEAFALRHTSSSADLLLDIAWLLKDPTSQKFDRLITSSQVKRYCYLLNFLICNDSTTILEKILPNLMILTESTKANNAVNRISDVDMTPLLKCMCNAREALYQKSGAVGVHSETEDSEVARSYSQDDMPSVVSIEDAKLEALRSSIPSDKNETIPLLNRDIIMNVEEVPVKSGHQYPAPARQFLTSRVAVFVIVLAAVCLGVCGVLLHPGRVGKLAISIKSCVFNYF